MWFAFLSKLEVQSIQLHDNNVSIFRHVILIDFIVHLPSTTRYNNYSDKVYKQRTFRKVKQEGQSRERGRQIAL